MAMTVKKGVMKMEAATIDSANNMPMHKALDIHLIEIGENYAVAELEVREFHNNCFDRAQGGLVATLIDTVSFYPKPLLPSGRQCTTTNLNINYIRPALIGDRLTARSELISLDSRFATVNVEVHNAKSELVAHGTATIMILS